jgi:hypothetical protein
VVSVITGWDDDRAYEPVFDPDDAQSVRRRRPRSEELIRAAQELPPVPSVPDDELASLIFPDDEADPSKAKRPPPERI